MKRRRIDVNLGELDQLLDQAVQAPLSEPDSHKIKSTLHTLVELLEWKRTTEKPAAVVGASESPGAAQEPAGAAEKKKTNGHGRNPASAYTGAKKVTVSHPSLKPGDACPECPKGKVYPQKEPRPLVRIVGQRRWRPRSITWNSCAVTLAGRCSRRRSRRALGRRSTTRRPWR
jgi:hypothetical protein